MNLKKFCADSHKLRIATTRAFKIIVLAAAAAIVLTAADFASLGVPASLWFFKNTYVPQLYGAKGDGVTDDTAWIQAAINAGAATGNNFTVYFPNGVYIIAGALQDTSGANAQLTLPSVSAPSSQQYTVRFRAGTPPSQIPWYLAGGNTPTTGVVIKSTLSSGNGSILSGKGPGGSFQNFTNITFISENIDWRTSTNPTNSGVDMLYVNSAQFINSVVDSGNWIGSTIAQPTTTTSFGLRMPQNNNGGNSVLENAQIIGFYTGLVNGEHVRAPQVEIYECVRAVEFQNAGHPSQFDRLLYHNCKYGLYFSGDHRTVITDLVIEHTDQVAWYATTYDIDDASNHGYGFLNYLVTTANTGYSGLLVNGGAHLVGQSITPSAAEARTNIGVIRNDYVRIVDSKGVADGGDFTSGAWQTRTLNTITDDSASIASVASNQFTLPAGTYRLTASAPALQVGAHQIRLYNVTDSTVVRNGTSEYSDPGALYAQNRSWLNARFTISGSKAFRIEHRCTNTKTGSGFGGGNAFNTENVFTMVEAWRE